MTSTKIIASIRFTKVCLLIFSSPFLSADVLDKPIIALFSHDLPSLSTLNIQLYIKIIQVYNISTMHLCTLPFCATIDVNCGHNTSGRQIERTMTWNILEGMGRKSQQSRTNICALKNLTLKS
jgi:hypothetical protein